MHQELFLLLGAGAPVLGEMEAVGLLPVFPELEDMKGVEQNGYHHLDVYGHSLATLAGMEDGAGGAGGVFWRDGRRRCSATPTSPLRRRS